MALGGSLTHSNYGLSRVDLRSMKCYDLQGVSQQCRVAQGGKGKRR